METLGIEATRRRLPELVSAAYHGKSTLITRHGKPYAALVPASMAASARPRAFVDLKGRARGVWDDAHRSIAELRDEWER